MPIQGAGAMGRFLFQAMDLDTGPWGTVTYSIYGPGADLYVDPTSGKASGRAWEAEGKVCASVRSEWGRTRPGFGGEHTARHGGKQRPEARCGAEEGRHPDGQELRP